MGHTTLHRARAAGVAPLSGLAVLLGAGEAAVAARQRLSAGGAWCSEPGAGGSAALRLALGQPGVEAVAYLGEGLLPVRPAAEIAAFLLDGREHATPALPEAWCITAACARHLLPLLEAGGVPLDGVPALVALSPFSASLGAAPALAAGVSPLRVADLPAVFGSGLPFAGPFSTTVDRRAFERALATAAPRRAAQAALPDGLTPRGVPPDPRKGEVLAVMVVRNEALRLPAALAHARRLGIHRVVVIDNGSSDGTAVTARAAGANLIHAPGSYAGSGFGIAWTNAVLDRWGRGHWSLVVDADELLAFPGSDRTGLPELCAHLDAIGSEALPALMLDCFPAGPLSRCNYHPGEDLSAAAPFFEVPRLREECVPEFPYRLAYGGLRERLFFPEADPGRPGRWLSQRLYNLAYRVPPLRRQAWFRRLAPTRSPTLTKVPLLRWREGAMLLASTHRVAPMRLGPDQPSGVLLHYKFLQDFHARAVDAVARSAHYDGSREYRRYLARVEAEPDFSLVGPRALAYRGPEQLVELGLMRDSAEWRAARGQAG